MDKIMKFINTIIKDAKIKLRKKNGDTDNEPDEEPQGIDEDDENPGNTTLTDGAKDKTAGINKKMVNLVLVGVALTFVVAFCMQDLIAKKKLKIISRLNRLSSQLK